MLKNFTRNITQQARQKLVLSNACERYCKVQFPICYSTVSEKTDSKVLDIQHDVSSISCDDKPTKDIILQDMLIYNDFITEEEEKSLFNEVEPYLKRMRYEYNHWDNVSEGPHRNRSSNFSLYFMTNTCTCLHRAGGQKSLYSPIGSFEPHFNRCRLVNSVTIRFCANKYQQMSLAFVNAPIIYHSRPYTDTEKRKGVGGLRTISAFCRKLETLLFHLANHR